jgi:uncharacterized transporter YbjL
MSDFDTDVADMDETLFAEFGEDATVQRGADAPVAVRAFVERGVEKLGEYGQVIARVTTVMIRNTDWIAQQGDVVSISGSSRKVESIDMDDGYVNTAVLNG